MLFILLLFSFLLILLSLIVVWTWKNGISPMPTPLKIKHRLLEQLPPLQKGFVYELGAGWGTLAVALAKKYPHCQIIAYENSPIPYCFLKLRLWWSSINNVETHPQDFFGASLHQADLVVCYLYPKAMLRLKSKFELELKDQTWVVSHTFAIPGWTAVRIIPTPDIYQSKIYFYRSIKHEIHKKSVDIKD